MTGRISSFQSLGAVDGPGLRCVVFLQGCPLRCAYCHNPETRNKDGGAEVSVEVLAVKIERLKPYLSGGVTISGGEPLFQPDFTAELLKVLKEKGFHTAIDTSGIGDIEGIKKVLKYTDLAICDIKFTRASDYAEYCGGDLKEVFAFLDIARDMNVPLWIRQVIVPGINDSAERVLELKKAVSLYTNVEKVELLPFRKLCVSKYDKLGINFPFRDIPECDPEALESLQKLLD